jgi:hypothetical protein
MTNVNNANTPIAATELVAAMAALNLLFVWNSLGSEYTPQIFLYVSDTLK